MPGRRSWTVPAWGRAHNWVPLGIASGLATAVAVLLWLLAVLLLSDGATWRILLPWLLFVLPALGSGAAAGWLVALGLQRCAWVARCRSAGGPSRSPQP